MEWLWIKAKTLQLESDLSLKAGKCGHFVCVVMLPIPRKLYEQFTSSYFNLLGNALIYGIAWLKLSEIVERWLIHSVKVW